MFALNLITVLNCTEADAMLCFKTSSICPSIGVPNDAIIIMSHAFSLQTISRLIYADRHCVFHFL